VYNSIALQKGTITMIYALVSESPWHQYHLCCSISGRISVMLGSTNHASYVFQFIWAWFFLIHEMDELNTRW